MFFRSFSFASFVTLLPLTSHLPRHKTQDTMQWDRPWWIEGSTPTVEHCPMKVFDEVGLWFCRPQVLVLPHDTKAKGFALSHAIKWSLNGKVENWSRVVRCPQMIVCRRQYKGQCIEEDWRGSFVEKNRGGDAGDMLDALETLETLDGWLTASVKLDPSLISVHDERWC